MNTTLNFHPVVEAILDDDNTMFQRADKLYVRFSVDGGINADIASASLNTAGLTFTCTRSTSVQERHLFIVNQ